MLFVNLNPKFSVKKKSHFSVLGFAVVSLALVVTTLVFAGCVWALRTDLLNTLQHSTARPLSLEERELIVAHLDRLQLVQPKLAVSIEKVRTALYDEKAPCQVSPSYLQRTPEQPIEWQKNHWRISETFFGQDSLSQEQAVLRALGARTETAAR